MEYCDLEAVNGVFGFGCFWVRIYEYPFDDLEMILWFFFFFFLFLRWLQNTERGFFFFVLLFSNLFL